MTAEDINDRVAIAALMGRYNINGDRGRVEALAALFGESGVLQFSGAATAGAVQIAARLGERGARNPALTFSRHHLTTSMVELKGDIAEGRTYFQVLTDVGLDHHGVYVDVLERRDGDWFFRHRDVRIDWQSPHSLYPGLHLRGKVPV